MLQGGTLEVLLSEEGILYINDALMVSKNVHQVGKIWVECDYYWSSLFTLLGSWY